jgi:hypothetical protein
MKSHTITKFSIDKAKLKIPAFYLKILRMWSGLGAKKGCRALGRVLTVLY